MKFRVTFKDPDGPSNAIAEAAKEMIGSLPLDEDERDAVLERREEKLRDLCRTWFGYLEYVTIEIDTEAKTATVVPAQ